MKTREIPLEPNDVPPGSIVGKFDNYTWKTWPGIDCPDCGSSAEIYSHEKSEDGSFESGDRLRCSDPECPRHTEDLGTVVAVGDDDLIELFDPWPIGDDDKPYRPEREEEKP